MRTRFFVLVSFLILASPAESPAAKIIYVSPVGDDNGKGTIDSPYATLERARDACRVLKRGRGLPEGGVTILVGRGIYARSGPLKLTAADSGSLRSPIVYRAQVPGTVRITGGKAINSFKKVTDTKLLSRLVKSARSHVLQADLKAAGFTDYGRLTERGFGKPQRSAQMELFFHDRPMTLARWPNQGYAKIAGLPEGKNSRRFRYDGDRPRRWSDDSDIWVYGYWYHDWADTYLKVENIDAASRVITTRNRHNYGLIKGARWFALNILGELDSPGEYYIDRKTGILYFWPPDPIDRNSAVLSVADALISAKDLSYVTFRGFVLEACRGTAITISGGSHVQIVGCTIRNTGNKAVSISGDNSAVIGCDIYNNGDGGISLRGGDRKTLTPAHLLAENNHIHDYSRWCHTYRPAIGGGGCGIIISHNLIHDAPHSAILLGGNDHLIEYNEIYNVCNDTGDCGAYYMGRDWTARGTIIRFNYWHNVVGPGRGGSRCVYLDDQASGITIYGNVFYKTTDAAFIGGGCDNIIDNNIFIDCKPAVHIDARGLGWQKKATDDPKGTLRTRLASMPYKSELWRRRYPNLVNILNDDPGTPKRNRIIRNICIGGKWDEIDKGTRKFQTIENNLLTTASILTGSEEVGFRLKPGISNLPHGFKPIPFERIGLKKDERRASRPGGHKR